MKSPIFDNIRKQIIFNETQKLQGKESKSEFTVRGYYPEKIIVWITTKAKAFKVAKVTKDFDNGVFTFKIEYKDINLYSPFLALAYEIEEERIEKYRREHEFDYLSVVNKAMAKNDKYRYELECQNYNYANKVKLNREDSCRFNLFIQKLGFNTYEEFAENVDMDRQEIQERIDILYDEFEKAYIVENSYIDGKETEGMLY